VGDVREKFGLESIELLELIVACSRFLVVRSMISWFTICSRCER